MYLAVCVSPMTVCHRHLTERKGGTGVKGIDNHGCHEYHTPETISEV